MEYYINGNNFNTITLFSRHRISSVFKIMIYDFQLQRMNNYDNVIQLQSLSQQDEKQLHSQIYHQKIQSFDDLLVELSQEVKQRYKPIEILHQSQNSVVVKCISLQKSSQKLILNDTYSENQELIKHFFVLKITQNAKNQQLLLRHINKGKYRNQFTQVIQSFPDSIVLQYIDQGLRKLIDSNNFIDTQSIIKLLKDFVNILQILKQSQIIHSDIKPDNILYRTRKSLKSDQKQTKGTQGSKIINQFVLIDFSSSFFSEEVSLTNKTKIVCRQTWNYRAPEWSQGIVDYKTDVWGLGCVLFQCLTGECLLPLQIHNQAFYNVALAQYVTPQKIRERLKRFTCKSQIDIFQQILLKLLERNPIQRPDIVLLRKIVFNLQTKNLKNSN